VSDEVEAVLILEPNDSTSLAFFGRLCAVAQLSVANKKRKVGKPLSHNHTSERAFVQSTNIITKTTTPKMLPQLPSTNCPIN
jgi:hypothetical protein